MGDFASGRVGSGSVRADGCSKKIIGSLSKGFRQRVGLADALVHNPMLLILDEPTAGLDPHQIRSFRELIKELGKDRTILLSTHILSEVEMVCGRAIIINKGKIEASDTLANLEKRVQAGALQIEVKADPASAKEKLGKIAEVSVVAELNRAGIGSPLRLRPHPVRISEVKWTA